MVHGLYPGCDHGDSGLTATAADSGFATATVKGTCGVGSGLRVNSAFMSPALYFEFTRWTRPRRCFGLG